MSGTEIEAKLVITAAAPDRVAADLASLRGLDALMLARPVRHRISDTYFDASSGSLSEKRIALRIRVIDEATMITVKGPTVRVGGVTERTEYEESWSATALDRAFDLLRAHAVDASAPHFHSDPRASLAGAGIGVVSVRTTDRLSMKLTETDARVPTAELAIDHVEFQAGRSLVKHWEIECEAINTGSAQTVRVVLESLNRRYKRSVKPFPHSKTAIAVALNELGATGRLESLLRDGALTPAGYVVIDRFLVG